MNEILYGKGNGYDGRIVYFCKNDNNEIRRIYMKSKLPVVLAVIVLVLMPIIANASENNFASKIYTIEEKSLTDEDFLAAERESLARYDPDFLIKQENSYLNYEKLMRYYKENGVDGKIYPDYYGGSYIDDGGDLVIYIKGGGTSEIVSQQDINTVLEEKDYLVRAAKYSYNELNSVMDILNSYKLENPNDPIACNFNIFWLSDRFNNIVVELDEINEEQIELFKENVLDSPMITFKESSGIPVKEVNIYPGQQISTSSAHGSMGYRAKINEIVGIITAGHLAPVNTTININGTNIGTVIVRQESGSVDAEFVEITNSNYTPTNTLNGTTNTLSTTTSQPGAGTVINKSGFATGATSGRVLDTNVTVTLDGITHTNLTSADYSSGAGDSGGIVYSYISATNTRYTLGIHCAAVGSTRYYIKADEINTSFGASRY